MFQVKDIMTDRVVTIGPDATIDQAVSCLLDHQVSGLPVVDESSRLLGVISEIDIIDLVYQSDLGTSRVRDHMTRELRTIRADASLDEAASTFCDEPIRRLPVMQDGRLVGILSRRDLIRFVRDVRREAELGLALG